MDVTFWILRWCGDGDSGDESLDRSDGGGDEKCKLGLGESVGLSSFPWWAAGTVPTSGTNPKSNRFTNTGQSMVEILNKVN